MSNSTRKNLTDVVLLIASLVGATVTIFDFIENKLPKIGLILIIALLSLIWIYLILQRTVLKKNPESYKKILETISKISIYILPVLIVAMLVARYYFTNKNDCDDNDLSALSIGIAYFEDKNDSDQAFSTELIATLKEKIDKKSESH